MKLITLWFLLLVTQVGLAQELPCAKIAVIERNNFLQQQMSPGGWIEGTAKYRNYLRPLFYKLGSEWFTFEPDSIKQVCSYYELGIGSKHKCIKGRLLTKPIVIDSIKYLDQCHGLYSCIGNIPKLMRLRNSYHIFEENDITNYLFVSSLPGVKRCNSLNIGKLTREELLQVQDSLNARKNKFRRQPIDFPCMDSVEIVLNSNIGDKLAIVSAGCLDPTTVGAAFSMTAFREDNGKMPDVFCVIRHDGTVSTFFGDMQLLDHADFDIDGKDEFLFFYSIFNHYGYVLFYNDFHNYTTYQWSYH